MTVTIYHNPRCSKSRQTLELLKDRGISPEVILYLKETPNLTTLTALAKALGDDARNLFRKTEPVAKELGLTGTEVTLDQKLEAIAAHPILLERPIVVTQGKAAIGRPPENVLKILP